MGIYNIDRPILPFCTLYLRKRTEKLLFSLIFVQSTLASASQRQTKSHILPIALSVLAPLHLHLQDSRALLFSHLISIILPPSRPLLLDFIYSVFVRFPCPALCSASPENSPHPPDSPSALLILLLPLLLLLLLLRLMCDAVSVRICILKSAVAPLMDQYLIVFQYTNRKSSPLKINNLQMALFSN